MLHVEVRDRHQRYSDQLLITCKAKGYKDVEAVLCFCECVETLAKVFIGERKIHRVNGVSW